MDVSTRFISLSKTQKPFQCFFFKIYYHITIPKVVGSLTVYYIQTEGISFVCQQQTMLYWTGWRWRQTMQTVGRTAPLNESCEGGGRKPIQVSSHNQDRYTYYR